MSTGYTAVIGEKEDVSFREFALKCSRAFGALVEMRDEPMDAPIPSEFKPSSYHKDEFAKACKAFYGSMGMRNDEAERLANKDYVSQLESHAEYVEKNRALSVKYGGMLAKVAKWQSPSSDHDNYRDFMISQSEESLQHDCGYEHEAPKKLTGAEYRSNLVERAKRDMGYHKKEFASEVKRAKERAKWVQDLVSSLPKD